MRKVMIGVLLLVMTSCSNRSELTEGHARATAEALIAANGSRIRDFHRLEWKNLEQVSPTEARGTAVMVYRFTLPNGQAGEEHIPGTFVYHRKPGQGWVLDHVDFPNSNSLYHRVEQQVFVKVTSATIPASAVENQIPALLARSEDTSPSPGDSLNSVAPPSSAAREAAIGYLATNPSEFGGWSATNFQPIRSINGHEVELPAMLVVETGEDTLNYRGGFFFSYDADSAQWVLRRLSFRSRGSDPIVRDVAAWVPVN